MIKKLLASLFGVSSKTINFVTDDKNRYFRKLALVLPLTAWSTIFHQLNPIFLKWQVDTLTNNSTDLLGLNFETVFNLIVFLVISYLVLNLLDHIFNYLSSQALQRISQATEGYLEDKFNLFLTRFDDSFLGSENNLRLIRNLQWGLKKLENDITRFFEKGIVTIFGFFGILVVVRLVNIQLLGIILVAALLDLFVDYLQNQAWRQFELIESRQSEQRQEIRWRFIRYFSKVLSNNWFETLTNIYKKRRESFFTTQFRQQTIDRRYAFLKQFTNTLVYAVTTLWAARLVLDGELLLGDFVVFGLYITRLKDQIQQAGEFFRSLFELRFELFRFDFLLNLKPKLDYTNIKELPKDFDLQSIVVKDLDFTYPQFYKEEIDYLDTMQARISGVKDIDNGNLSVSFFKSPFKFLFNKIAHQSLSIQRRGRLSKEVEKLKQTFEASQDQDSKVLSGINLELKKGNVYAIVGYNGAGKTTFTSLLKRSLDPSTGSIELVDGAVSRNLKTVDPVLWKGYLNTQQQTSLIWETLSVRENLLLGSQAKEISDYELWQSLEKVGLKNKISSLDLIMGEGLELSGGQSQLLELARVLVQQKPLVILDEGTNQLDAQKEAKIMDLLHEIKQNSIVIFISHRMTSARKCDQVIVLEKGKITAGDNPDKLLQQKTQNLFKEFWAVQVG